MGAACSSSVLKRYGDVKAYLQSKECMTFDVAQAFLPIDDKPPVILLGENHIVNDSDFGPQACLTAFGAINELVSDCEDPSTKIFFVVEQKTYEYSDTQSTFDGVQKRVRFSLRDVWKKTKIHAHNYDGLKVVPFDMFYTLRGYYSSHDNNKIKRSNFTDFELFKFEMKMSISKAFEQFEADNSGLPQSIFDECDARVREEIESYRENVGSLMDKKNAESERLRVDMRRLLESEIMSNFDAILQNEYKPRYLEADIDRLSKVYRFDMFKIVYWIYCFTSHILILMEPGITGDLEFALDAVNIFFDRIIIDPELNSMFAFITLCGDFITYAVYLRPRLQKKGSNSIYVLYGGTTHMLRIARLIEKSSTHKKDFLRVSERACLHPSDSMRAYCDKDTGETAEKFVDIIK